MTSNVENVVTQNEIGSPKTQANQIECNTTFLHFMSFLNRSILDFITDAAKLLTFGQSNFFRKKLVVLLMSNNDSC